jgi:hypothetical protein
MHILDLFDNPVGYRTSLAKYSAFCRFLAEVVQKLKFLNNSIYRTPLCLWLRRSAAFRGKSYYTGLGREQSALITRNTVITACGPGHTAAHWIPPHKPVVRGPAAADACRETAQGIEAV